MNTDSMVDRGSDVPYYSFKKVFGFFCVFY